VLVLVTPFVVKYGSDPCGVELYSIPNLGPRPAEAVISSAAWVLEAVGLLSTPAAEQSSPRRVLRRTRLAAVYHAAPLLMCTLFCAGDDPVRTGVRGVRRPLSVPGAALPPPRDARPGPLPVLLEPNLEVNQVDVQVWMECRDSSSSRFSRNLVASRQDNSVSGVVRMTTCHGRNFAWRLSA